jgi:hypothetical protein
MDRIVFLLLVRLEPTQRRRRRRRLLWPWPVGRMASARSAAAPSPTSDHPPGLVAAPWRPRGGPVPPSERRPSSNQSSNRHERMGTEYWATYSGLMENRRSPE